MDEIGRILDQMDRAFAGDAWHGPSLMRLLEGLSAEEASKHPAPNVHSIWELVHHIGSWKMIAEQRLRGNADTVTSSRDWPPVWEVSEAEWKRALDSLAESHARLHKTVETLSSDDLHRTPEGARESRYVLLHGVVQHDLYHAGQIAVLRKVLRSEAH